jgi:hypothetical protein
MRGEAGMAIGGWCNWRDGGAPGVSPGDEARRGADECVRPYVSIAIVSPQVPLSLPPPLGIVVTRPCVPVACAGTTAGVGVAADGVSPSALRTSASSLAMVSLFSFRNCARILASLADALAFVAEPRPGFLHDVAVHRDIEQVAFARNAFAIEMSNSASRNGAATLFFTTLTRVREPVTTSPSLMAAMRRISMRTDE